MSSIRIPAVLALVLFHLATSACDPGPVSVVDGGEVAQKDITSQAIQECREQCDYHHGEQDCTQTDSGSWYSGCYSFCQSYVTSMPTACRDKFRVWQSCEHSFTLVDPWPPGGGWIIGNDGCWTCGGQVDPIAWPVLACDRCAPERSAYYDCI